MSACRPVLLLSVLAAGLLAAACSTPAAQPSANRVVVSKTPSCGCCAKWVDHMKAAGFEVEVRNMESTTEAREKAGVPIDLASCHTATVDGYALEGHVPSDLVRKMLKERPKIAGLAVAGMPIGSPGMEQPGFQQPYDVTAFDNAGKRFVYARR